VNYFGKLPSFQFNELSLQPVKSNYSVKTIHMTDLNSQYQRIKSEIDHAIQTVLDGSVFINGKEVGLFASELADYLGVKHVVTCGNGTDALQIALMALDLPKGAEVITAGYSYAAVAEVCGLLELKAVYADVDPDTFNIDATQIESLITKQTKVILPVHLFGQCADMETICRIAEKYNLYVIEDNAQSIGADCRFNGKMVKSGAMGHLSTTSFFPSKNLGCYGDGGAICTNDDALAGKIKMIANHGQSKKYHHEVIGMNSRLDTIQAAILRVKLKHLDNFIAERQKVAEAYDRALGNVNGIEIPKRAQWSNHVFHQYTLKIKGFSRQTLQETLKENGIPTMVYYPLPLYKQMAYFAEVNLPVSEALCETVLSLPIGTDMSEDQIDLITSLIIETIKQE